MVWDCIGFSGNNTYEHCLMDKTYSYLTVNRATEGLFSDKGSKFIAYVIPVLLENDFKIALKELRNNHPNARHFCYAYRVGETNTVDRSSDDGEPSGTAGKPILNQLLSYHIQNVAVIVVRYFGGILLGTTGLIQAYKSATKIALEKADIIEKDINIHERTFVSYISYNECMNIVKKYQIITAIAASTDLGTELKISIPLKVYDKLTEELNAISVKWLPK